ncbi:hypothetical protein AcV7_002282 [Taiwanofungus camphoratus]|nr:hypothetical protein AcV7_002282 [Antrodia cinnamomea]
MVNKLINSRVADKPPFVYWTSFRQKTAGFLEDSAAVVLLDFGSRLASSLLSSTGKSRLLRYDVSRGSTTSRLFRALCDLEVYMEKEFV